jgi:hypothetical protein
MIEENLPENYFMTYSNHHMIGNDISKSVNRSVNKSIKNNNNSNSYNSSISSNNINLNNNSNQNRFDSKDQTYKGNKCLNDEKRKENKLSKDVK